MGPATLYEQFCGTSSEGSKDKRNPLLQKELERREQEQAARTRKILVCGDVRGDLSKLFTTVEAQNKKVGPFDALFCVGAFLPEAGVQASLATYLKGEAQPPLDCYFIDSGVGMLQAAPAGKTVGANIHYLGAYGVRDICGLRTAFLSGRYDPSVYDTSDAEFVGGAFTARAVKELQRLVTRDRKNRGIDLLLTSEWPACCHDKIEDESQHPPKPGGTSPWLSACALPIAELCLALEPRYHIFGTAGLFYQRPPFQTPQRGHVCRCIALGQVGGTSKQQRWMHALALSPMAHMKSGDLMQVPAGTTPNPFADKFASASEPVDSAETAAPADSAQTRKSGSGTQDASDEPAGTAGVSTRTEHDVYQKPNLDSPTAKSAQAENIYAAKATASLMAGNLDTFWSEAQNFVARPLLCRAACGAHRS